MVAPVFIGDEITAAGYRLAGALTLVADDDAATVSFERALETAELLLITATCAARLPERRLQEAMRGAKPLVLIVPDVAARLAPPDLDQEVDRVLGIES